MTDTQSSVEDIPAIGITSQPVYTFLSATTSPEHKQLFIRAFTTLDQFGLVDIQFQAEELALLANGHQYETQDILTQMENLVRGGLFEILQSHKVSIDVEASFSATVDICECLWELTQTESSEAILRVLEASEDNATLLCSAFELVGNRSAEDYLNDVWDADESLLFNLRVLHEKQLKLIEETGDAKIVTDAKRRMTSYHRFLGTTDTRVYRFFNKGLVPGLPLKTYYERFNNLFVTLPNANAAVELYGFLLLSEEHKSAPMLAIEPHLEGLFGDMSRVQEIRRILQNVMVRYNKYLADQPKTV